LKQIKQQVDNDDELKDTDVFKEFKDCIKNLQDRSSDTQHCISKFFNKKSKKRRSHNADSNSDNDDGDVNKSSDQNDKDDDDDDESPRKKAAV
jgi:hypothetical protein